MIHQMALISAYYQITLVTCYLLVLVAERAVMVVITLIITAMNALGNFCGTVT